MGRALVVFEGRRETELEADVDADRPQIENARAVPIGAP